MNFVIYSTTLMVCFGNTEEQPKLPCVSMGEETVDPLRDERVAKVVRKQGMKHCCAAPCSFGGEGEVEHSLLWSPNGIATNSSGQFIVGDKYEVKIFDPSGEFIQHFSLPNQTEILDVATDNKDNIYVLVCGSVYKFRDTTDLQHKFPVREGFRLTVTNSKVLVLSNSNVNVYDTDGLFVCSFGEGAFGANSIAATNDGRVMVADWRDCHVHIFSEGGHHFDKFRVQGGRRCAYPSIAFHMLSEHVVVVGEKRGRDIVVVEIFTKDGVFARTTEICTELIARIRGMTVTRDGRIAMVGLYSDRTSKVLAI